MSHRALTVCRLNFTAQHHCPRQTPLVRALGRCVRARGPRSGCLDRCSRAGGLHASLPGGKDCMLTLLMPLPLYQNPIKLKLRISTTNMCTATIGWTLDRPIERPLRPDLIFPFEPLAPAQMWSYPSELFSNCNGCARSHVQVQLDNTLSLSTTHTQNSISIHCRANIMIRKVAYWYLFSNSGSALVACSSCGCYWCRNDMSTHKYTCSSICDCMQPLGAG